MSFFPLFERSHEMQMKLIVLPSLLVNNLLLGKVFFNKFRVIECNERKIENKFLYKNNNTFIKRNLFLFLKLIYF